MILGLTGGIGCGKSTASRFFVEAGFQLIDSDRIVRDELLGRADVVAEIGKRFPDCVSEGGEVLRPALAKYVFTRDDDRVWLESLLHPLVYESWRAKLATKPKADWVVEAPLLFEQDLENWFDFTVCVSTTLTNQLVRLTERGLSQSLAEQRISKQLPLALKLEKADFVLSNDGTPEALRLQVLHLVSQLRGDGAAMA